MKKKYHTPTIESEGILEQTSLACTVTQEYDPNVNPFNNACSTDIAKGNTWDADYCDPGDRPQDSAVACVPVTLS